MDYIGVFRDLRKALAIYAAGRGDHELPVADKEAQADEFLEKLVQVKDFLDQSGVDLHRLVTSQKMQWVIALGEARERLVVNDLVKVTYLNLADEAAKLWKAVKPHPAAAAVAQQMWAIVRLSQAIRELAGTPDVSQLMEEVELLLEESIAAEPYVIETSEGKRMDLSEIPFDALAQQFKVGGKNTEAQRLRGSAEARLDQFVRLNPTRIDYAEKLQEMVERYNSGSANLEEFFEQLMLFTEELTEEETRAVREELSEEELTIFDLLTRPEPKLTKAEKAEVKKVARELLAKLKNELLVLDWKKRQATRAAVQVAIQDELDKLPDKLRRRPLPAEMLTSVRAHLRGLPRRRKEHLCRRCGVTRRPS